MATIEETVILEATAKYLASRGALPYSFSLTSGQKSGTEMTRERLVAPYGKFGCEPDFVGKGPDVLAYSETEWWAVECKGLGTGKAPTLRNNFDRAWFLAPLLSSSWST